MKGLREANLGPLSNLVEFWDHRTEVLRPELDLPSTDAYASMIQAIPKFTDRVLDTSALLTWVFSERLAQWQREVEESAYEFAVEQRKYNQLQDLMNAHNRHPRALMKNEYTIGVLTYTAIHNLLRLPTKLDFNLLMEQTHTDA